VSSEARAELFVGAVREAFKLAKGEEAARLRGRRLRTFNDQGIHPFSQAVGRVVLAAQLVEADTMAPPEGIDLDGVQLVPDAIGIKQAAKNEAMREFIADAKAGKLDQLVEREPDR
jgi:hypothetical protein